MDEANADTLSFEQHHAAFERENDVSPFQVPIRTHWRHSAWNAIKDEFGVNDTGVAAALHAVAAYRHGYAISYSRDRDHYRNLPNRYRGDLYTYKHVTHAVEQLAEQGLVIHDRREPNVRGWRSAFQPRLAFVERTEALMGQETPTHVLTGDPIRLHDSAGNLMDYRDNQKLERSRRRVDQYNSELRRHDIRDPDGNVVTAPVARIFNESFQRGGRIYALGPSWQQLPKTQRPELIIDDESVTEVDYKAFHPTLAYAQAGLKPPTDPYELPGWSGKYRDLIKAATNVALNAKSKHRARSAIAFHDDMRPFADADAGTKECQRAFGLADRVLNDIMTAHSPIRHAFFNDTGIKLMNVDSRMALEIVGAFVRDGEACLPIHDSFVVRASQVGKLKERMTAAAEKAGIPDVTLKEITCGAEA